MPIEESMDSKESGLTVGELTMTIGALIIAALIWSSFGKKQEANPRLRATKENRGHANR